MTTKPAESTASLDELSRAECLQLVRSMSVGRIAFAEGEGPPVVVPVNYAVDGEAVVFRTGAGAKRDGLRGRPVSFQVDFFDPFSRSGWSVLLQGRAVEALHWEVDHLEVQPWAGGVRPYWVRVEPLVVTGRRIRSLSCSEADERGYL